MLRVGALWGVGWVWSLPAVLAGATSLIPTGGTYGGSSLPPAATFWTPRPEEISEDEGFGFFQETWPILGITPQFANELIVYEREIASVLNELSEEDEEFERRARSVEQGEDEGAKGGLTSEEADALHPYMCRDDWSPLEGLEVGVAGLTYAVSAAGMYPAASCRGHTGTNPWSFATVVLFATDRQRAQILQPIVARSGCGFDIDQARPDLLVMGGRSILDTMRLAVAIVEHSTDFQVA